ncbi:MAG: hypothetical protein ACQESF_02335 [Nanobdellota archaeon]
MTKSETLDVYKKLEQKYMLPGFEKVKLFLETSSFDDEELALIQIKKKAYEKIHKFMEALDSIVQPETTAVSMYENSFFSEGERVDCFEVYKRLMELCRYYDLTCLSEKDEDNAEFIKEFFRVYEQIKPKLEQIIKKQKDSWKEDSEINNKVINYFG